MSLGFGSFEDSQLAYWHKAREKGYARDSIELQILCTSFRGKSKG